MGFDIREAFKAFFGTLCASLVILLIFAAFSVAKNYDADPNHFIENYGTDDPSEVSAIKLWYQYVVMNHAPYYGDNPIRCCGEGDAYWADKMEFLDGQLWVTITDPRMIPNRPNLNGQRLIVPAEKIDQRRQGNPTGHNIIFVGSSVYCFFPNISG